MSETIMQEIPKDIIQQVYPQLSLNNASYDDIYSDDDVIPDDFDNEYGYIEQSVVSKIVDKKRKQINNVKTEYIVKKQLSIIAYIRFLHDKRTKLIQTNKNNKNSMEIEQLNVEIAELCEKLTIFYQVLSDLHDKAKKHYELLKNIKKFGMKIFEAHNLPTDLLSEYFNDEKNQRWYYNGEFWKNKLPNANDELKAQLKQLDVRCMEFEKIIGRSPSQYNTVYNKQIRVGMKKAKDGRDKAINSNIRLVMDIATKRMKDKNNLISNINYNDVYMEGIVGLTKAVDKFEYQREFTVSTYATWWIRQSVDRHISEHRHIMRGTSDKSILTAMAIINKQYNTRYYSNPSQNYMILKYLLLEYTKQKGIPNILPKDFIDENYPSVVEDVEKFLNGKFNEIESNRLFFINILAQEFVADAMKGKGGRKPNKKQEKNKVVPTADYLIWHYLLELYEQTHGIESFESTPFFQQKLNGKRKGEVQKIKDIFYISQPIVSLEGTISDEENSTYKDMVLAEDVETAESTLLHEKNELNRKLMECLANILTPRELMILTYNNGINIETEMEFVDIAKELGIGAERVRQLNSKAISTKLRNHPDILELYQKYIKE